ncbi:hypothetical protein [Enterovibrio norvegicus]|uniref:Uncharacterized protein n=1 Tax=Enterovibrio norvegicus TaxID=188144 RepID=A0A2N7L860_9GAMM|nr:hypothetical protein [Enterovibrio norvegicus]PMN90302.1 hypothetical protein BCT23_20340 [Enterovibrio norvegicus]
MKRGTLKDKLQAHKPKEDIDTEIGTLCCYYFSAKDLMSLDSSLSKLDKNMEDIEPKEYVRMLAKLTCYPASSVGMEAQRPERYILSDTDVEKLSDTSLEKIALKLLDNPTFESFSENGETKNVFADLHAEHLDTKNQIAKNSELINKHLNSLNSSAFSTTLQSKLFDTSVFGNSLQNQMNQIRESTRALDSISHLSSFPTYVQDIMFSNDDKEKSTESAPHLINKKISLHDREEAKAIPLRELGSKLDQLVEVSAQSLQYITQMNENMRLSAEETKKSSDAASRNSRLTIIFTLISILISIIALKPSWVGIESTSSEQQSKIVNIENATEVPQSDKLNSILTPEEDSSSPLEN